MRIGISKSRPNYFEWLRSGDSSLDIVDLSSAGQPIEELASCDGVLLSGGEDIHPRRYGMDDDLRLCGEIDEQRDALELEIITASQTHGLPLLAICRGEQILNVAFGGTLFADIYAQNGITMRHTEDGGIDQRHPVTVEPGSLLHKIVRSLDGEVNSSHHQAVRDVGRELRVSARAADGTIEAIERADPMGKPFLLAVQWHPERMEQTNPFAHALLGHFLFEVAAHAALKEAV